MKETPDWNETDLQICQKYDDAVRAGTMTYRVVKI